MIKITTDQKISLEKDGYLHIKEKLFSDSDFSRLKNYLLTFHAMLPEKISTTNFANDPNLIPRFSDWSTSPPVIGVVEQILGPDLALWSVGYCYKPANSVYRVGAHTDSHFWILWDVLEPVEVLGIFIAITPMSKENGCLRVLPEVNERKTYKHKKVKHSENFFAHEIEDPCIDLTKMVDIEMDENEICLTKENLIHSSENNKSNKPRLGVTLRFISAKTKYTKKGNDQHELFLVKGRRIADNEYSDLNKHIPLGGFSWST